MLLFLRTKQAILSRPSIGFFLPSHWSNLIDNAYNPSWWGILECNSTMSALNSDALWGTLIKFLLFFKKNLLYLLCKTLLNILWVSGGNPSNLAFFSVGVPQLEMTGQPGTSSSLWVSVISFLKYHLHLIFLKKLANTFSGSASLINDGAGEKPYPLPNITISKSENTLWLKLKTTSEQK